MIQCFEVTWKDKYGSWQHVVISKGNLSLAEALFEELSGPQGLCNVQLIVHLNPTANTITLRSV